MSASFDPQEWEISIEKARAHLEDAADSDAFLFAIADEGEYDALVGYNDDEGAEVPIDQLLGVLILLGSDSAGVHPSYLGHMATQRAIEKYEESGA